MGKKSSAKQASSKKNKGAAGDASKGKADAPEGAEKPAVAAAAAVTPSSSDSVPTSWLESLNEQERALEEAKMKERAERAQQSAKADARASQRNDEWYKQQEKEARSKEKEDRKWKAAAAKAKQKAKEEGILQAEDWGDAWWVNLGGTPAQYIEVQGEYYCTLCSKHLNEGTLESHMDSQAHQKKVAWNMPSAGAEAPTPNSAPTPKTAWPAASTASAPAPRLQPCPPCDWSRSVPLEEWQEVGADGLLRCIPCGKVIDENHLAKADHENRLEQWLWKQGIASTGYPEPELPYIAWMPYDENDPKGERSKKCLLCNKWLQDETSHTGTVESPGGSKEHQKNLRNYGPGCQWYEDNVVKVRNKWHPNSRAAFAKAAPPTQAKSRPMQATAAPWAKAAAAAAASAAAPAPSAQPKPAPWAKASPAAAPAPAPPAPVAEWLQAIDPSSGKAYYYHSVTRDTRWDPPPGFVQEELPTCTTAEAREELEVEC